MPYYSPYAARMLNICENWNNLASFEIALNGLTAYNQLSCFRIPNGEGLGYYIE